MLPARTRRSLVRVRSLRSSRVEDYRLPVAVAHVVSVETTGVGDLNRRRVGAFVPVLLRTRRRGRAVVVVVPVRRPCLVLEGAPRSIVDLIVLISTVRVGVIPGGEDAPRTTVELSPDEVTGILVSTATRRDVSGTDNGCRSTRDRASVVGRRTGIVRALVLGVGYAIAIGIPASTTARDSKVPIADDGDVVRWVCRSNSEAIIPISET